MRRIPRLRTPAPAGFAPSSVPASALRAPPVTVTAPSTLSSTPRLTTRASHTSQTRRYLSTTPLRAAQNQQPQNGQGPAEELQSLAEDDAELYEAPTPTEINTQLVYPYGVTTAPLTAEVADPSYKPAETADGLEEVGGLSGWWDEPTHWGSEGGVAGYVHSATSRFGPAERVTDPAVLEVLTKRAIVEAIVVAKFAGANKRKHIDRLFAHSDSLHRLEKIVRAEIVVGKNGEATIKENADWQRVYGVLKAAARYARRQEEGEETGEREVAEAREVEAKEAETPAIEELTPEVAKSMVESWDKGWKKAELRDPVVKFFVSFPSHLVLFMLKLLTPALQAAKRIQQLTGHRVPDGKLLSALTIDSLLKQLVEPPKPKKLAELVETQGVFKDLSNVRVFPRRVTPIDKEKMVGRWKIIVKELEKRDLPVIGTGKHSGPIEKKWIEGKA